MLCAIPYSENQWYSIMNDNKLNRWLTLGANLGVLIGIILLVVELDQNRAMIKAQTRNDVSRQLSDFLMAVTSDAGLFNIKFRAERGEELTPEEQSRFFVLMNANIRLWENVHYQYRQGLFEESEYEAERNTWRNLISWNQRFEPIWCSVREHYSDEFVQEIDSLIEGEVCPEVLLPEYLRD